MGFEWELAGCILLKWAVVLPGQFAGTFVGPDIYCQSFILVVILLTVLLSVCVPTAGLGWHRAAECSLNFSFVKPAADPSAGVSHTVLWWISIPDAFQDAVDGIGVLGSTARACFIARAFHCEPIGVEGPTTPGVYNTNQCTLRVLFSCLNVIVSLAFC